MSERAVVAIASPEVVQDLRDALTAAGIPVSEPAPMDSPADALDSPISGEEIRQIFETVTVMLQTGTAILTFRGALRKAVHRNGSSATVKDARTGEQLGEVTPGSEELPGLDEA